ncbi:acyl-CoA dehydrogenase [Pseudomonas sp. L-22-4S-12]|uniref:acyl-CoA dehydrogenase family protein n=1 Tax=Pseudomonas sp. L-22-4S-12 TaxID=2610893 RepID=UPI00132A7270|nr:acyl-CoA dehydrogenase family protein [Pseudomonas sp. L-22-4S-12]MWV17037.1 acyl-CoA dehydrogenase [Pseudomonas sp. L-22-4S-12]
MNVASPTEDQRFVVESFRQFLASEIEPIARGYRGRPIPKERMLDITQAIAEFGLPGASVAKALGGLGLSLTTEAMLFEELSVISLDIAWCVITNRAAAMVLAELPATQVHLRDRYLADILAGRVFAGFCLSNPDLGGSLVAVEQEGDSVVLCGEESWVANGHFADLLVVAADSAQNARMHVIVDRKDHGYVSRKPGRGELTGQPAAQIAFSGVRVLAVNCIWAGEAGLRSAHRLRAKMHTDIGLLAVGLMRAALDASITHVRQLRPADRSLPGHHQLTARLAEMATAIDAARLMCFQALSLMDASGWNAVAVSMAKWLSCDLAVKVCRDALQLQGSEGAARGSEIERLVREAMVLSISAGSTDCHKQWIADAVLGTGAQP